MFCEESHFFLYILCLLTFYIACACWHFSPKIISLLLVFKNNWKLHLLLGEFYHTNAIFVVKDTPPLTRVIINHRFWLIEAQQQQWILIIGKQNSGNEKKRLKFNYWKKNHGIL